VVSETICPGYWGLMKASQMSCWIRTASNRKSKRARKGNKEGKKREKDRD